MNTLLPSGHAANEALPLTRRLMEGDCDRRYNKSSHHAPLSPHVMQDCHLRAVTYH